MLLDLIEKQVRAGETREHKTNKSKKQLKKEKDGGESRELTQGEKNKNK